MIVRVAVSETFLVDAKNTARTVVDMEQECNWPLRSQIGTDDYIDRKEFTLVVLDRSVTVPFNSGVEEQLNTAFDDLKGESYCNNKTWGEFYSSEGDELCNGVSLPIYPDLKQKYANYANSTKYENSAKYEALYAFKVCEKIVKVIDSIEPNSSSPSMEPSQFPSDVPSIKPSTSQSPSVSNKPSEFPSDAPSSKPTTKPPNPTGIIVASVIAGSSFLLCCIGLRRFNRNQPGIQAYVAFAIPPLPSDNESDFAIEDVGNDA